MIDIGSGGGVEVAELPRMLGVHQAIRQPSGELLDHLAGTHRRQRGRAGPSRDPFGSEA